MKLTDAQRDILRYMAREPGDGHLTATWIAESCGHAYDTPWASSRLPGLVKRGLVRKLSRGWYTITPVGLSALHTEEDRK